MEQEEKHSREMRSSWRSKSSCKSSSPERQKSYFLFSLCALQSKGNAVPYSLQARQPVSLSRCRSVSAPSPSDGLRVSIGVPVSLSAPNLCVGSGLHQSALLPWRAADKSSWPGELGSVEGPVAGVGFPSPVVPYNKRPYRVMRPLPLQPVSLCGI
jgi:hypothetical protein